MTERPPPREAVKFATAFVDTIFMNGGGEKADRLVLTQDSPHRDLGGWCRGAVRDRLARAFARYHAERLREMAERANAGDDDPLVQWLRAEAARHAPEAEGE